MELDPRNQIQPISEFRSHTEKALKSLTRLKSIVLTQYGKTRAIIVDPQTYEEQLDRLHLAEKILRGQQELTEGKGMSQADVESLTKSWVE